MCPVAVMSLLTASFHNSVVGSIVTVAFGGVCIARAVIGFDFLDILDHEVPIKVLGVIDLVPGGVGRIQISSAEGDFAFRICENPC